MPSNISSRTRKTFQLELYREFFEGIVQAASNSVGILVLIEVFIKPSGLTGEFEQSVLFASTYVGMIFSIFLVPYFRRFKFSGIFWIMTINTICGFLMISAGLVSSIGWHTGLLSVAYALLPLRLPYFTEIYHQNYPKEQRGMLHGFTLLPAQVALTIFSYIAGRALNESLETWRLVTVSVGVSIFLSNIFIYSIPKPKVHVQEKHHLFKAFKDPIEDKLFGYVLLVWFIFGFAHLWVTPIRIQYLSMSLNMNPEKVALLAMVSQEVSKFLFIPIWAFLFDRYNFILLRICLNVFLAAGLWIFFHADSDWLIAVGSAFIGVCTAGGSVTWNLWVTKFVPSKKTAEYMSVHIASSGLRGVLGPFAGFSMLLFLGKSQSGYQTLSEISVSLVILSVIMLIPVIKMGKREVIED